MSDAPDQGGWSYAPPPPGSTLPPLDSTAPGGYPPPGSAAQPPEGTNPGSSAAPQPGAPGYPPYPYAPAYAGPMAPATSGWAIASLVCSIAGIFFILPLIGSILGVIFGHIALNEIKHAPINPYTRQPAVEGHGLAVAGLVLGYAVFALMALAALCAGVVVVAGLLGGAQTTL